MRIVLVLSLAAIGAGVGFLITVQQPGHQPWPLAGPRRSLEMHQMFGSVDSTLRLLDLGDEGRFPLMSHVWRLDIGTNRENAGALEGHWRALTGRVRVLLCLARRLMCQ
jgi:hypothetical protein